MVRPAKFDGIETDALIIGAGPVGLFQAFQLGLLEVQSHIIDALPHPGGQCAELYPDKPIYDIPGVPVCTGLELTQNLLQQMAPMGAVFHLRQQVTRIEQQPDNRFLVETSRGSQFLSKTIFIAAGVGAFQARKLLLEGLDAFDDQQVFYHAPQNTLLEGQDVVILGGEDAAVDCAIAIASRASHPPGQVLLVHRRDVFKATPDKIALMRDLIAAQKLQLLIGQMTGYEAQDNRLKAALVSTADGTERRVPLDSLLVFLGLSPKLGPLAHWGLAMERKQLKVDTEKFSTSTPGIFAVGDINTYPGKKKLLLCGFHECTLAAHGAMSIIAPTKPIFLQYTTTSPRLHQILGVEKSPLHG